MSERWIEAKEMLINRAWFQRRRESFKLKTQMFINTLGLRNISFSKTGKKNKGNALW